MRLCGPHKRSGHFGRQQESLSHTGIRNLYLPARSLVAIEYTLSWVRIQIQWGSQCVCRALEIIIICIWQATGSSLRVGTGWRLLLNFVSPCRRAPECCYNCATPISYRTRFVLFFMINHRRYKHGPVTSKFRKRRWTSQEERIL